MILPSEFASILQEAFQKLMQEAAAGRPDWRSFAHRWRPEEEAVGPLSFDLFIAV